MSFKFGQSMKLSKGNTSAIYNLSLEEAKQALKTNRTLVEIIDTTTQTITPVLDFDFAVSDESELPSENEAEEIEYYIRNLIFALIVNDQTTYQIIIAYRCNRAKFNKSGTSKFSFSRRFFLYGLKTTPEELKTRFAHYHPDYTDDSCPFIIQSHFRRYNQNSGEFISDNLFDTLPYRVNAKWGIVGAYKTSQDTAVLQLRDETDNWEHTIMQNVPAHATNILWSQPEPSKKRGRVSVNPAYKNVPGLMIITPDDLELFKNSQYYVEDNFVINPVPDAEQRVWVRYTKPYDCSICCRRHEQMSNRSFLTKNSNGDYRYVCRTNAIVLSKLSHLDIVRINQESNNGGDDRTIIGSAVDGSINRLINNTFRLHHDTQWNLCPGPFLLFAKNTDICVAKKQDCSNDEDSCNLYMTSNGKWILTCSSCWECIVYSHGYSLFVKLVEITYKPMIMEKKQDCWLEFRRVMEEFAFAYHLKRDRSSGMVVCPYRREDDAELVFYGYVDSEPFDAFLRRFASCYEGVSAFPGILKTEGDNWIKDVGTELFPFVLVQKQYYGFEDGILNIKSMDWIPYPECNDVGIICRKYFNQKYLPDNSAMCPLFDTYLNYQLDSETKEILIAMMGRTFFEVSELDKWEKGVLLVGTSGVGKSTLVELLQHFHQSYSIIGKEFEQVFGLEGIYSGDVVLADDIPANFGSVFPQETWQKCVSGSVVNIAQKRKTSFNHRWLSQFFLAANEIPNWNDSSDQISRRLLTFMFLNILEEKDTTLLDRMKEEETPAIIKRCLEAYHSLRTQYSTGLPKEFKTEAMKDAAEAVAIKQNASFDFLMNSGRCEVVEGERTASSDFLRAVQLYHRDQKKIARLDDATFLKFDSRCRLIQKKVCRACNTERQTNVICCNEYNAKNRKNGQQYILNLRLKELT